MSEPLSELAALEGRVWLVGGAVRDELLGRPTADYDVAIDGDAGGPARTLARAAGGHAFPLSDAFGAWRVMGRDGWQVDLTPLMGETLVEDLRRRDLTINAIARGLGDPALIDPFGGIEDLRAGQLRMVAPDAFASDPLRVVRVARMAAELGFDVDPQTAAAAGRSAPALASTPGERVFAELKRIIAADRAVPGLELLESLGAADVVLPELVALKGIDQSVYHHLDVHDHTLATLQATIELERDPSPLFGEAAAGLTGVLAEPLGDGITRGQALRFGALLHDIAKTDTHAVTAEGRVTFFGHDVAGAELAHAILTRLRASERLASFVAALTRHHLRLGFLVHEMPLGPRAVYAYLATCEPVEVEVTALSVADRLATRGRGAERAIDLHMTLACELLPEALRWRADRPRPPIRGDALAAALGITPGPELGALLEQLTEAAYAGEIDDEDAAVRYARQLLGDGT